MNHSHEHQSNEAIDELLIQKLVDGELDHETRSQILKGLSDDSPRWKEIALAFVESQIFDETLRTSEGPDVGAVSSQITIASSDSATQSSSRHYRVPWFAGLAASLLLGFLFGVLMKANSSPPALRSAYEPTPVATKDALAVNNANLDLSDALSRCVAPVPDEFRRAMRKAGYSIQDKQTLTNVALPSGGQIELPIRRVDVTFVGLSSFQ